MKWFLVLGALLAASPALAQEDDSDERAKALYQEGTRLYEQGLYEEAVAAFKIAYSLSRRPLLLYNMAQAMERIGQWDEALEALVDYKTDAPPEELDTLNSRIDALQARIDERDAEQAANTPEPVVVQAPRRGPPPGAYALFANGCSRRRCGIDLHGTRAGSSVGMDGCLRGRR